MGVLKTIKRQLGIHHEFMINLVSIGVAIHGAFIVASTLVEQTSLRHSTHASTYSFTVPLFIGFSLLYLSSMLWRRKRTAWVVASGSYGLIVALNLLEMIEDPGLHAFLSLNLVRGLVLPVLIISMLVVYKPNFTVKSDVLGFRSAARTAVYILLAAFIYGVIGFTLLDRRDFHQQITLTQAAHYTIDQFGLTTTQPIHPYNRRAHIFLDSLSVVSVVAFGYALISLFQPLRLRYADQTNNRNSTRRLLDEYHAESEDFFKLWPHDKQYFFSATGKSVLAYHVSGGIALCLGDPSGDPKDFSKLLKQFSGMCRYNDWQPAHIHTTKKHLKTFRSDNYEIQKIGQEAVVDLTKFRGSVATNKYFRHIRNKFEKQGYSTELIKPPHNATVMARLKVISDDWLSVGGRVERRFVMGYYQPEYMQMCDIMVARDAQGSMQAFLNMVPASFDTQEATYDLLRHTKSSPGNINDFLLLEFMEAISNRGYARLNMGLCPLVGLEKLDKDSGNFIDSVLRFAYANGDRVYSFSGLQRFKAKYEPDWQDRFVVYRGGLRSFSRVITALTRTMRLKNH